MTPLLNLPWLLLLVTVLVPAGGGGGWAWAAGVICLGLCFQLYFFFWTAALLGIGALHRDPGDRLVAPSTSPGPEGLGELKFAAAVLAGGIVLGAPQVYGNARTFADPSIGRSSTG